MGNYQQHIKAPVSAEASKIRIVFAQKKAKMEAKAKCKKAEMEAETA